LLALVIAIVAAGLLGSLLLRLILKPLDQVVAQATALGERRFTTLPEPATHEFARVTRAMNSLTLRVQDLLAHDAQRLVEQRRRDSFDALTGLQQREPFMDNLSLRLQSEEGDSEGALALVRINRLSELNQKYGRKTMDVLLEDIGNCLRPLGDANPALSIAHINASDFIVLAPQNDSPEELGSLLVRSIRDSLIRHDLQDAVYLPAACTSYQPGNSASQLMSELDEALMLSASTKGMPITVALEGSARRSNLHEKTREWAEAIGSALSEQRIQLSLSPVLSSQSSHIQSEAELQLHMNDEWIPANMLMPWAHRSGLDGRLDRAAVSLGLEQASRQQTPVCISLSFAALSDASFAPWLEEQLAARGEAASRLRASISESIAFNDPLGFNRLQRSVKKQHTQLGIQQVGHRVSDVGLLSELGADYLKIDRLFIQGIDESEGKRALLQIYVNIARALGVPCIADGVESQRERDVAIKCGASGVAGPAIS
ncbi:EAL domain-containing protein, partial [Congregibacter sp.]